MKKKQLHENNSPIPLRRSRSPGVLAHQMPLGQDVPLDGLEHRLTGRTRGELGSLIERVEAKEIAMDSPRWAGASVTDLAEIVPALGDGEPWLLDDGLWIERRHRVRRDSKVERRDAGRQFVKYPVGP